jgi:hypothetical protein
LTQVCGRWRYLTLGSPSWLGLHLLCTHGVPIAKMLAHFPSLSLAIYYSEDVHKTTEEDEQGILLALRHSDRVHHISLRLSPMKLRKIIRTMDEQFPILEHLHIVSHYLSDGAWMLPRTFQAPQLRHIWLWDSGFPIGSPLLTTSAGLVSLMLHCIRPSPHTPSLSNLSTHPTYLLTQLIYSPNLSTHPTYLLTQLIYSPSFHSCPSWRYW